jgi:hypothetical protein
MSTPLLPTDAPTAPPTSPPPTMPPTDRAPVPPGGPPPARRDGRVLPALLLIALGVVFLAGNLANGLLGGGALFLGLGAAFLVARVVTGQYGLAVPAGVLLGFGSFVSLQGTAWPGGQGGGWFFVMLGLGFLAVYIIGARVTEIWPFFPAAALIGFGLLVQGLIDLSALAAYAWIAPYWPVILLAIGAWLLVRDALPRPVRALVATIGLIAIIVYGLIAVGATVASGRGAWADGRPNFAVGLPLGIGPSITDTVTLATPVGATDLLTVNNPNGRTSIRAAAGGEVRVTATRRSFPAGNQPEPILTATDGQVTLETRLPAPVVLGQARIDYVIEAPTTLRVAVESASGDVDISEIGGGARVRTASGDVTLTNLSGAATVTTASGEVQARDISGEVRLTTVSGDIEATNVVNVREVSTTSGEIDLAGIFSDTARVASISGDISLRALPGSAFQLEVSSLSGEIRDQLDLTNRRADRRHLSGTLGGGAGMLTIQTTSGDVRLSR